MKENIRFLILLLSYLSITSCANLQTNMLNNSQVEWDFDHNIQFRHTQLSTNSYQLEMIPNNRGKFERLAAFLLRKSYIMCGSYYYKIEMIQGIEGFDDKRVMPNYITPSLIAKIECKPKLDNEKN